MLITRTPVDTNTLARVCVPACLHRREARDLRLGVPQPLPLRLRQGHRRALLRGRGTRRRGGSRHHQVSCQHHTFEVYELYTWYVCIWFSYHAVRRYIVHRTEQKNKGNWRFENIIE